MAGKQRRRLLGVGVWSGALAVVYGYMAVSVFSWKAVGFAVVALTALVMGVGAVLCFACALYDNGSAKEPQA